jgi:hypothetical protein
MKDGKDVMVTTAKKLEDMLRVERDSAPRERPVIFSGPMVKAILDGRKTQTRRIVKPQPRADHGLQSMWGTSPDGFAFGEKWLWREVGADYPDDSSDDRRCPYGVPGDRLWVRETLRGGSESLWRYDADDALVDANPDGDRYRINWRKPYDQRWPAIHMPRWASRITLEVTDVRVERLQAITEEDARAEGCWIDEATYGPCDDSARDVFGDLWDQINRKRAPWSSNPWVWRVAFRRITT